MIKLALHYLIGNMHGFYYERSLQYRDCENTKTYKKFWWKSQVWPQRNLVQNEVLYHFIITSSDIFIIFNAKIGLSWCCNYSETDQDLWWKSEIRPRLSLV